MKIMNNVDRTKVLIMGLVKMYYPDYDINKSLEDIRHTYVFDATCSGSVPFAIKYVLESESYEDAIKLAISLGGDSDTLACIAGSIAGVLYDKPESLVEFVCSKLPNDMINIIDEFDKIIE